MIRLAAVLLLLAALFAPADARAHAGLVSSEPSDGASLEAAPPAVVLTFTEPVTLISAALIGAGQSKRDLPGAVVDGRRLTIPLPADLSTGTHLVSWWVTSDDGHPVAGTVTFGVGAVADPGAIGRAPDRGAEQAALWIARILVFLGLFVGAGGALFRAVIAPDAPRWPALGAAVAGLVAVPAAVALQGLDAMGAGFADLATGATLDAAAGSGALIGGGLASLALEAAIVALLLPARGGGRLVAVAAWLMAGATLAAGGHAATAEPRLVTGGALVLHGLALAFWIGALAPLGLMVALARPGAPKALARFSHAAPPAVALLAAGGLLLAAVQSPRPGDLLVTDWGRVLLVKLALVAALLALAAANRWRWTRPALAGAAPARRAMGRAVAAEIAIAVAVVAVAGLWRWTPPPRMLAVQAERLAIGPSTLHLHGDPVMADVTVSPSRVGPVEVSIAVKDRAAAPAEAAAVSLRFTAPGGALAPVRRSAERTERGHWVVRALTLPVAGAWSVRVEIRIDDFTETRLEGRLDLYP